jgi:OmpA family
VLIEGHTDGKGTHAYNMTLSDKRAACVKGSLVQNGGAASRITTRGWGEAIPTRSNMRFVPVKLVQQQADLGLGLGVERMLLPPKRPIAEQHHSPATQQSAKHSEEP